MDTKNTILEALLSSDYISGEALAQKLNISRNAVWKTVKALKKEGYDIIAVTNRGYKLINGKDIISEAEIRRCLINEKWKFCIEKELPSTNVKARELADKNSDINVVIADGQSAGKGRIGRKFFSPKGVGIYMSIILKPNLSLSDSVKITTFAAVAVSRAIEKLGGENVKIKWVNDLFINDKKICGILTEANCNFETNITDFAICGIGIDVLHSDLKEFSNVASSIEDECSVRINRSKLIGEILNNFDNFNKMIISGDFLKEYKNRSLILGRTIKVESGNEVYYAKAIDINENGALLVMVDDKIKTVNAGDVSIRI